MCTRSLQLNEIVAFVSEGAKYWSEIYEITYLANCSLSCAFLTIKCVESRLRNISKISIIYSLVANHIIFVK